MSRTVFLLAFVAIVVIATYFAVRSYQDAYKILPVKPKQDLAAPPFEGWQNYTAASGRFRVAFPALAQHATDRIRDPKTNKERIYNMYVAEKADGSVFMVNLITMSKGSYDNADDEKVMMNVMTDLMASNPDNQLIRMDQVLFEGHSAYDFEIANDKFIINAKTFVIGNTLFVLTGIAKKEGFSQSEYHHFIESFELGPLKGATKKKTTATQEN